MQNKKVDVFFTPYPDCIPLTVMKYTVGAKILDGKRVSKTSHVKPMVINKENKKNAILFNKKMKAIEELKRECSNIYASMEGFDAEKHLPVKEEQK